MNARSGPLVGLRVLEAGGIGPAPFAGMILADLGADVVRIDRPGPPEDRRHEVMLRGRRSVVADLRDDKGLALARDLMDRADILIEGFRPGVMERLGLGPAEALERNPKLVYGRMTGWGQDGPIATEAGHDITYIARAGLLHAVGRAGAPPTVPLNIGGDFGGGGLLLALGVVAAALEAKASGRGQVVDAAMTDGAALLIAMVHGLMAADLWRDERGVNLVDSGAPWYDVYETSDGRWMAVGALEDKFFATLLGTLGLPMVDRDDPATWPTLRADLAEAFAARTQKEWEDRFAGIDACVAPGAVAARGTRRPATARQNVFTTVAGVVQPSPAPRFSRTPGAIAGPPPVAGEHTDEVVKDWLAEVPA
jgi:alpha-methylacyl-CoA racemase